MKGGPGRGIAASHPVLTTTGMELPAMAFISLAESARARLAAMKGVHITADPLPRRPEVVALVMASIRCAHVTTDGAGFSASVYLRAGEWLALADGVSEDAAFAAVLHFVHLVASVPQH